MGGGGRGRNLLLVEQRRMSMVHKPSILERIMKKRYEDMAPAEIHRLALVSGVISGVFYAILYNLTMKLFGANVTWYYTILSGVLLVFVSYGMCRLTIKFRIKKNSLKN
jgi:hypothetical protein